MFVIVSRVIVLTDSTHRPESESVFVGTRRVNVVEGGGVGGVSIAAGKINAHSEVDLTTSHNVLQERIPPRALKINVCSYITEAGS